MPPILTYYPSALAITFDDGETSGQYLQHCDRDRVSMLPPSIIAGANLVPAAGRAQFFQTIAGYIAPVPVIESSFLTPEQTAAIGAPAGTFIPAAAAATLGIPVADGAIGVTIHPPGAIVGAPALQPTAEGIAAAAADAKPKRWSEGSIRDFKLIIQGILSRPDITLADLQADPDVIKFAASRNRTVDDVLARMREEKVWLPGDPILDGPTADPGETVTVPMTKGGVHPDEVIGMPGSYGILMPTGSLYIVHATCCRFFVLLHNESTKATIVRDIALTRTAATIRLDHFTPKYPDWDSEIVEATLQADLQALHPDAPISFEGTTLQQIADAAGVISGGDQSLFSEGAPDPKLTTGRPAEDSIDLTSGPAPAPAQSPGVPAASFAIAVNPAAQANTPPASASDATAQSTADQAATAAPTAADTTGSLTNQSGVTITGQTGITEESLPLLPDPAAAGSPSPASAASAVPLSPAAEADAMFSAAAAAIRQPAPVPAIGNDDQMQPNAALNAQIQREAEARPLISVAMGEGLDAVGRIFGVPRLSIEADVVYRARIQAADDAKTIPDGWQPTPEQQTALDRHQAADNAIDAAMTAGAVGSPTLAPVAGTGPAAAPTGQTPTNGIPAPAADPLTAGAPAAGPADGDAAAVVAWENFRTEVTLSNADEGIPATAFAIDSPERLAWLGRKKRSIAAERVALQEGYKRALAAIDRRDRAYDEFFMPQARAFCFQIGEATKWKTKTIESLGGPFAFRDTAEAIKKEDDAKALAWATVHVPAAVVDVAEVPATPATKVVDAAAVIADWRAKMKAWETAEAAFDLQVKGLADAGAPPETLTAMEAIRPARPATPDGFVHVPKKTSFTYTG